MKDIGLDEAYEKWLVPIPMLCVGGCGMLLITMLGDVLKRECESCKEKGGEEEVEGVVI